MTKTLKRIWLVFAFTIIFFAVIFSLFRGITPWISQYRVDIEHRLSAMLGEEVHIGAMETGWYWFEPVVKLKAVQMMHGQQKLVEIGQLFVGIDLPLSLWNWQFQPGILSLKNLHLNFQQTRDGWEINGLSRIAQGKRADDPAVTRWLIPWLLKHQKIQLQQAQVRLNFLDGTLMPFTDVNLKVQNRHEQYNLTANARMSQTTPTHIKLQGVLTVNDAQYQQTQGKLHLQVDKFLPGQWQALLPQSDYRVRSGQGHAEFWIGINEGIIHEGQAKLRLNNLALENRHRQQQSFLQSLETTAYWQNSASHFQLELDDLALRFNGINWPENQLQFRYDKTCHERQLDLRYVDLDILKYFPVTPGLLPKSADQWNWQGRIEHLHLRWTKQQLGHLFARFKRAGWSNSHDWPAVEGLSGVIQLDHDEGRLRLDSDKVTINAPGWPETNFDMVSADINWQHLPAGWDITIKDFNLRHPHLDWNTQGTIRQWNEKANPVLDLNTHFLVRDAQYWKPWLPKKALKPKLYQWLNNAIEQVPELVGEMIVKGQWQDFPFDQNNGSFRIESVIENARISPLADWPAAHSIDGNLWLNGRTLGATIYHGWFEDVLLKGLNLQVNGLGTDRENLILHTRINDSAKDILHYILQTPLRERLKSLMRTSIEGDVDVDLQLDAMLYSHPEPIVLKGEAIFSDNGVKVAFDGLTLPFEGVSGNVHFDCYGILDSALQAQLWHIPLSVNMRSIQSPVAALQIGADIPFKTADFKQQWPSPWWELVEGDTEVLARVLLTANPNDLDTVQLRSNLQGLAIKLPPPFAKKASVSSSLQTTIDFNANQGFLLQTQWDKRIGSHLWFDLDKGQPTLEKGEIRLGSTQASRQVHHGLQLVGEFSAFDDRQWQQIWQTGASTGSDGNLLSSLNFVDLIIDKGHWLGQELGKSSVQARKLHNKWQIQLKEKSLKGRMQWDTKANKLWVKFNQWQIADNAATTASENRLSLSPQQLPELDLQIDHVLSGKKDWGKLTLAGKAQKQNWRLENLQLKSNAYTVKGHGLWKNTPSGTHSEMDLEGFASDLDALFHQFGYPSLMQAKSGYLHIKGNWPGAFYAPTLDAIKGEGYLAFKNGFISELSKETEEKIGLGKLLSIFSLQTMPRRLRLDFSDLSNRGYTFDKIEARFKLKDGFITTTDSTVNGPVAHATINGNLNLRNKQCDLKLQITPHITASLPVVATIAGGPIAGIATWIVNRIVTSQMERVRGYSYRVTGPWSHPVIEQGDITRQKITRRS